MTATVATADVDSVVKRADTLFARKRGDDPAPPEYVKAIADAVRPLLGQPVAAPVDDVQVKQLLADKQRLDDLAGELRKQADSRAKVIDRQVREIADLKQQLATADEDARRRIDAAVGAMETPLRAAQDEVEKLRHALTLRTTEVDEARAERDTARAQLRDKPAGADGQLQAENAELADQLAQAQEQLANTRRNLELANRTLDEIADEQESQPAHAHQYPVDLATGQRGPCSCRKPWIRDLAEGEEVVPDVEPLDQLFARIRNELGEAS